jgi:hypothetical protein
MKRNLLILFSFLSVGVYAQSVTISKVELAGDKIIVHYNLENSNPSSNFLLNLYESKDNFSTPLARVSGDVGSEVKPGSNKKIEWNVRQEYGNYKGKLALELRGKVYVPFVKLQTFTTAASYKRGKTHDLLWSPGNTDPINIELYKGNQRIQGSMSQPNNGAYSISIPSNAKTGGDYRLKISSAKNNDEVIYSSNFKVTPKVPLLVKVLPVVLVGGAVVALGGGSKGGDNGGGGGGGGGEIPTPSLPPGG